jgi:hypothetical protein
VRIHLFGRRGEHDVYAALAKLVCITLEITGILLKVLSGTELRRVYEDGGDGVVCMLQCKIHEREVPTVERTHRRNKTNGLASSVYGIGIGLHL